MSSPSEKLSKLQDILIDEFINRISSGEAAPADLSAARQLLKDNGISAIASADSPLEELCKILPFNDDGVDKVMGE